jgi:hypothetical protein
MQLSELVQLLNDLGRDNIVAPIFKVIFDTLACEPIREGVMAVVMHGVTDVKYPFSHCMSALNDEWDAFLAKSVVQLKYVAPCELNYTMPKPPSAPSQTMCEKCPTCLSWKPVGEVCGLGCRRFEALKRYSAERAANAEEKTGEPQTVAKLLAQAVDAVCVLVNEQAPGAMTVRKPQGVEIRHHIHSAALNLSFAAKILGRQPSTPVIRGVPSEQSAQSGPSSRSGPSSAQPSPQPSTAQLLLERSNAQERAQIIRAAVSERLTYLDSLVDRMRNECQMNPAGVQELANEFGRTSQNIYVPGITAADCQSAWFKIVEGEVAEMEEAVSSYVTAAGILSE